MSNANDDDLSAIAWPGFVDILSAVIIMFVFFLMIVATALYFHILIFKSQILAQAEDGQVKVESEETAIVNQIQTQFAKSKEQTVEFNQETRELVIFFGVDSISLLPENLDLVESYAQQYGTNTTAGSKIEISASKNPRTYETAARKVALARLLNVRNGILKAGIDSSLVDPKVVDGDAIKDSHHWVKITFGKKS